MEDILGQYSFDDDLPIAQISEREDAALLEKYFPIKILSEGNSDSKWDFKALWQGSKIFTIEHKEDMMAKKTGNIAVEYQSRGSPSGISVSEADYYMYRVHTREGKRYFMIRTDKLKDIIKQEFYIRKVTGGDKGSDTKMFLFKLDTFERYAKELHLEEDEKYSDISKQA